MLFKDKRSVAVVQQRRERSRLTVRAQKLAKALAEASTLGRRLHQSSIEQAAVPWETREYALGLCDNCHNSLDARGRGNCRLCGRVTCEECLVVVPLQLFLLAVQPHSHIAPRAQGGDPHVLICGGQCRSVATTMPAGDDGRLLDRLSVLHTTLMTIMGRYRAADREMAAKAVGAVSGSDAAGLIHLRDRMLGICTEIAALPLKCESLICPACGPRSLDNMTPVLTPCTHTHCPTIIMQWRVTDTCKRR
jgi:hypothetical protein